jgi:4-amino-4-deoxy-L-arabinose transferase-like glycosyltransferase
LVPKPNLKILFIVFSLAVLARWAGVLLFPDMPAAPDTIYEYDPIAMNVVAAKGFIHGNGQPDSIRGPGYPLFLATIYGSVGKSHIAVRLIQSMLDGAIVILVMHLTWILWGNGKRAIIAGSILSLYPLSVYSSNLVAVETIFCFMFFISVFLFIKGCRSHKPGLFVASGLLLGASVLIRSTSLFFPFVMGIWLFAFKGISKKNARSYICLLLAFAAIIMPWSIRNYYVFDEFILTSTNGGINLYLGSSLAFLKPHNEKIQQAKLEDKIQEMANKGILSPRKTDLYFCQLGWQNYKNGWFHNPLDVAKLLFYKAIRFWYGTDSMRHEAAIFALQIPFFFISIVGIAGAIRKKQCPAEVWLLVLSVVYFWLVAIVMFPLARYTIPIIPMLAIFASLNIKPRLES